MSNDLIFSILPRNTKVPIESDNRVKKVVRSEKSEALNQDEKEQHDEVHIVDEMAQRERHEENNEKKEHPSNQVNLFFSSRRRHTSSSLVSWARRCV